MLFSALDIELDVYSGVPNPTWTVESSAAVFNSLVAMLVKAKSTPFSLIAGYRGFIVQVRISGGAVVTYRFRAGQQMSLETALLNSNIALDIPLVSVVTTGIKGQVTFIILSKRKSEYDQEMPQSHNAYQPTA